MQVKHLNALFPAGDGINKVTAMAWSPNNMRLAVVTMGECVGRPGRPLPAPLLGAPWQLWRQVHLHAPLSGAFAAAWRPVSAFSPAKMLQRVTEHWLGVKAAPSHPPRRLHSRAFPCRRAQARVGGCVLPQCVCA